MRHQFQHKKHKFSRQIQGKLFLQIFYQKKNTAHCQNILYNDRKHKPCLRPCQYSEKSQKKRIQRLSVNVHRNILLGIIIDTDSVYREHSQKKCQKCYEYTDCSRAVFRHLFQSPYLPFMRSNKTAHTISPVFVHQNRRPRSARICPSAHIPGSRAHIPPILPGFPQYFYMLSAP